MKITNVYNLPEPLVDAVKSEYTYTPRRYSATQILQGNKQIILTRRHDEEIESDVSDMVWLIFGKAVHKIIEESQESENQFKEDKVTYELSNGNTISGIFDLYDAEKGIVYDWKTVSEWKVIYQDWDDYRTQLLIYALILKRMGFDVNRGEIGAFIKDFNLRKSKTDESYPQHPFYQIGWNFTEDMLEDIEQWLTHKTDTLDADLEKSDDEIEPCSEEERWHKPDTWAVVKVGNKKASKVCQSEEEALAANLYYENKDSKPYEIQFRHGEDGKCMSYCSCCEFCSYWKEHYGTEL